jgi:hypothetical protein
MAHPLSDAELDAMVDAALEQARHAPEPPRIIDASYHRDLDLFVLKISSGQRLVFPRENLQFVADATPEQAAHFTTEPRGAHIWWPELDDGFRVGGLLEGLTGNAKWMEKLQRVGVAA